MASTEFCEREKRSREDMIIPPGFVFRPTDDELLIHYLKRKSEALTLPCEYVFERDIYGVGNKAPWQIFSKEDPWIEAHTIYVLTRLIKLSKNGSRVARTAGCGSWVAETGPKNIKHKGAVLGSKKMLSFRVNNDPGEKDKHGARKDHWIMHEYSLGDGESSGEYVFCKITNKSAKEVSKFGPGSVADDDIVPKPSKRARMEFVPEKKMDCDIAAEPQTEVVCPSKDQFLREPGYGTSGDPDDIMFELKKLGVLCEEEPVRWESWDQTAATNADCHIAAKHMEEPEPLVEAEEPEQGFSSDFDRFEYISSTTEVLHSGVASVPENVLPPKSFCDDCDQYLNLEQFECGEDLSNTEILSSAKLLPGHQESNEFLLPNFGFDAATEPSPTSLVSNNTHVQLDPEIIWGLKNMSWPESSFPQYGYGGEIDVL